MKKIVAVLLALLIAGMLPMTAFAADQSKSTKLTTSVPGASYTLNIPASQEIPYSTTSKTIGNVTVTESAGFSIVKNLKVTITYDAFISENPSVKTTIPYELLLYYGPWDNEELLTQVPRESGVSIYFFGCSDGQLTERAEVYKGCDQFYHHIDVSVGSDAWNNAMAGNYSSTITFSAEVVSSESE